MNEDILRPHVRIPDAHVAAREFAETKLANNHLVKYALDTAFKPMATVQDAHMARFYLSLAASAALNADAPGNDTFGEFEAICDLVQMLDDPRYVTPSTERKKQIVRMDDVAALAANLGSDKATHLLLAMGREVPEDIDELFWDAEH